MEVFTTVTEPRMPLLVMVLIAKETIAKLKSATLKTVPMTALGTCGEVGPPALPHVVVEHKPDLALATPKLEVDFHVREKMMMRDNVTDTHAHLPIPPPTYPLTHLNLPLLTVTPPPTHQPTNLDHLAQLLLLSAAWLLL